MRDTLEFRVQLSDRPSTWLGADGQAVDDEKKAVQFTLYKLPREGEKIAIDMRCHELAGGLRVWLDLEEGVSNTYKVLMGQYELLLWPRGRPEAENREEREAQTKLLDQQWMADDSAEKRGYLAMTDLRERLVFLATWPTLFQWATVNDKQVDDDWEAMAERSLGSYVLRAIMRAYEKALAEVQAGKPPPSTS